MVAFLWILQSSMWSFDHMLPKKGKCSATTRVVLPRVGVQINTVVRVTFFNQWCNSPLRGPGTGGDSVPHMCVNIYICIHIYMYIHIYI